MNQFNLLRSLGWRYALGAVLVGSALMVVGCGGGSTPNPGTLAMQLTDGPSSDFSKAYVTITEIKVHQSSTAVDVAQSGWISYTLPTPLTVNLNSLSNGALQSVVSGLSLPAGTYGQIRLILAAWDDPLTSSAQSLSLQFNDTIVENDGTTQYPLEIAYPTQGLALNGTFIITSDQTLELAIEFDVGNDIVRFKHGIGYAYTFNPTLHYYDLSRVGAITGQIDTLVCSASTNPCSNVVVKAEALSADGTYNRVVRWTAARSDGTFTLYPLPAASGQKYDIMVRGRYAQTVIVQSVPVTIGSTPSNSATVLSATPLQLALASEYTVNTSGSQPSSAAIQFYQTPSVTDKPYEIRFRQTDPFNGTFYSDEPLVMGNVLEGSWVSGSNPALTPVTPQEGTNTYQVWFSDPFFTRTAAGTVSATSTITGPALNKGSTVAALGTITGTLTAITPGKWTSGQLVITRFGKIINTVDVSSVVGNGGSYTITSIPAGSASMTFPQGYYYAYLRLWNASSVAPNKVRIVRIPGYVDLRNINTTVLNATLP